MIGFTQRHTASDGVSRDVREKSQNSFTHSTAMLENMAALALYDDAFVEDLLWTEFLFVTRLVSRLLSMHCYKKMVRRIPEHMRLL